MSRSPSVDDRTGPPPPGADASARRLIETHVSSLWFEDDLCYKMKKPVKTPFLDFSSPELRRQACLREVELNRRLAPDVYLGVAEIAGREGTHSEPVVVMRRMPDQRRLSTLIRSGTDAGPELRRIARLLAVFHERTGTSPEIDRAGAPEAIRAKWLANLGELRAFVPRVFLRSELERVARLAGRFLDGRSPLFESRIRGGRIRDGHGDLLADDIFCLDDGPRILDAIEFDDHLRWGDVLEDAAFLAMDLERLGRPDLADRFLALLGEYSGDRYPASLADFSIAYRALVRAKVGAIRFEQGAGEALREARQLLRMAAAHLDRARIRLVLVGGLPGSGKSTLAGALADRHGWSLLRTDAVRREIALRPSAAEGQAPYGEGSYAPERTRHVYAETLHRAAALLAQGETVLIDASWQSAARREQAAVVADEAVAELVEIQLAVPVHEAATRIRRRMGGGHLSEATPEVRARMAADADAWRTAVTLDGTQPPGEVVCMAEALLFGRCAQPPGWLGSDVQGGRVAS